MSKTPVPEISPLIEKWHPDATREEQVTYTDELRAMLLGIYRVFERADAEGRFPDSPESGSHDIVESVNPSTE